MNINKAIVLFIVMLFRRIQGCDYRCFFLQVDEPQDGIAQEELVQGKILYRKQKDSSIATRFLKKSPFP